MSEKLLQISQIVFPIFLMVFIGYVSVKTRLLNRDISQHLSRLTFRVLLPFLIFLSIARSDILVSANWSQILISNVLVTGFVVIIGAIVLLSKISREAKGVFIQGAYRSNMAYIGLPVCLNAFGEASFAKAALFLALLIPLYNILAVFVLLLPNQSGLKKEEFKNALISVLKNPLIIASVMGFVFSAFNIPLHSILIKTIHPVGEAAFPLALFAVGTSMNFSNIGKRLKFPLFVALLKLVIYPGIAYFILTALGTPKIDIDVAVLMFATPTAISSYIMAREMHGDERLAADIVMITTLGSVVTLSVWLLFLL